MHESQVKTCHALCHVTGALPENRLTTIMLFNQINEAIGMITKRVLGLTKSPVIGDWTGHIMFKLHSTLCCIHM